MAFPVPSEAFAAVEINGLIRQGVDVQVKALRSRRSDYDRVSQQQKTAWIPVSHANIHSAVRGFAELLCRPLVAVRLLTYLMAAIWRRPLVLAGCLWWSLRCFELLAEIRCKRPGIVHLYWGHVPAVLGWLILETLPNQKLTTSLSAYDIEMALPISFEVARRANGVRTWSPSNIAALTDQGVPLSNVEMIYQGIDLERFNSTQRTETRKTPGLFTIASRLIPEKGVAEAIRIIAQLSQMGLDVRLQIFGDGPQQSSLEQLATTLGVADRISFCGHVDHAVLARGLAASEFFILHSTHVAERMPNALKEAIASGCYCFTTPTPDVEQLIVDDHLGEILPACNVESGRVDIWVDAIASRIENRSLVDDGDKNLRHQVLRQFDQKHTSHKLAEWWGISPRRCQSTTPRSPRFEIVAQ